jgi:hypothetical protein
MTLIRTSLAYVDHAGRFKVLAPIREYIHKVQPPSHILVRPLQKHFQNLVQLWMTSTHHSAFEGNLTHRVVSNLGNLHNVLLYGLECDHEDLQETIEGVISFIRPNLAMNRGLTPLIFRLPELLAQIDDPHTHAKFITEAFHITLIHTVPDLFKSMNMAFEHFHIINDLEGEGKLHTSC